VAVVVVSVIAVIGYNIDKRRAEQSSVLSGFFETQPTQVQGRQTGRVAQILVNEGDAVSAGAPLVLLETTPAREDTAAKEELAKQAGQYLAEVANGPRPQDIQKQVATVAQAQAQLDRLLNGPLPEEIKEARDDVAAAKADLLKALNGPRPQEIASAKAAEQAARQQYAAAQRGPTAEEKAEARAKLDADVSQTRLAQADDDRMRNLFASDAVTRQQLDDADAALAQAQANQQNLQQVLQREQEGTPAEELEQAHQEYLQAKAQLDLLLAGTRPEDIQSARATLDQRTQSLAVLVAGSRKEDIAAAQAHLVAEQATLSELRAGSRREDIAQAQAGAMAARAVAASSKTTLGESTVTAPMNAVVDRVLVAKGDLVTPDTPLVRLEDLSNVWIRVYVPEEHLAQVSVGAAANLHVDGIAAPVAAVVESISSAGEFTPINLQAPDERGQQVFAVRLRPTGTNMQIKAGMYASVKRIGNWKPE
jgi:multidrug resistance efflux pump